MANNFLYFGDNLDVLQLHIAPTVPVRQTAKGLSMCTAKMSGNGQCLSFFPWRCSGEGAPITPEITGLSPVFHTPRLIGTPLAFTVTYEVIVAKGVTHQPAQEMKAFDTREKLDGPAGSADVDSEM